MVVFDGETPEMSWMTNNQMTNIPGKDEFWIYFTQPN